MHRPAAARERVGGADGPTAEEDAAKTGHLAGQFLIAMPSMGDPRFARSLVYICLHSEEGALGIIVNRALEGLSFEELLRQLNIEPVPPGRSIRMHRGGPVEAGRGFVLHSADWVQESSLRVSRAVALTASVEILKEIAQGRGPERGILALGYAGWGPGQLDREIQENAWLSAPADAALLFDGGLETKWQRALAKIGVDPALLSGAAGHA
ncbi:MAG: YqgE/AlgH family protein [Alphaproteobacteria bacterium]|nr:YqgE/AlgH family protein [Alphaproteobacteria bacterium]